MLHRSNDNLLLAAARKEYALSAPDIRAPQSGLALILGRNGPAAADPSRGRRWALRIKHAADFWVAALALIALSPALAVIALTILVADGGPAIYSQRRLGLGGKTFRMFKFRTIRLEACDPTGVRQFDDHDPAVTRLGRVLRSTRLDELPQLLNILRGEMSFVGPRPHVPLMRAATLRYDALVPYYRMRLAMRPGLTGWAQVNGHVGPVREAGAARARVDHDLAYIQNFSLKLDLAIVLRTLRSRRPGI